MPSSSSDGKTWYDSRDEWTEAVTRTGRFHHTLHLVKSETIEWRIYDKRDVEFARWIQWDEYGWVQR